VRAGTTVKLSGLGKLFDGEYVVVRVLHTYDLAEGFRTRFDVERPGIGAG
jgi:phage protein D